MGPGEDGLGVPQELYCLRPDWMRIEIGRYKKVDSYNYLDRQPLPYESILHIKFNNQHEEESNFFGQSPLEPCWPAIKQNYLTTESNISLLENSCIPSLLLKIPEDVSEDQFESILSRVKGTYSGSENTGKVIGLTGGIDAVPIALKPTDMNWEEMRKIAHREICLALGVPTELVGDEDVKIYANVSEAHRMFFTLTILPLMDFLRDELK